MRHAVTERSKGLAAAGSRGSDPLWLTPGGGTVLYLLSHIIFRRSEELPEPALTAAALRSGSLSHPVFPVTALSSFHQMSRCSAHSFS